MSSSTGPSASVSRWAMPDDGSSSSRTDGSVGQGAGQVDDAARAGGQLADELVGVGLEAHQLDQARRPRSATARSETLHGGRQHERGDRVADRRGGARSAVAIVWRTVIDGNRRASWNDRPRPARPGRSAASVRDVDAAAACTMPSAGRHEARDEVEHGGLARTVGADDPQDLTLVHGQVDLVHRLHAAEARSRCRAARGPTAWSWPQCSQCGVNGCGDRCATARFRLLAAAARCPRGRRPGGSRVGRAARAVGPSKRTSPFSMNTARSARVMATLTDCSTSTTVVPPAWMARTIPSSCSTTIGARPRLQLVDEQQPRPGDERLAEGEHLLLAAGEVAGLAGPSARAARGRTRGPGRWRAGRARGRPGTASRPSCRFSATVSVGKTPLPPGIRTTPAATVRWAERR